MYRVATTAKLDMCWLVDYIWFVVRNIFFIVPYIGNNDPNWLIFFQRVETTNQLYIPVFSQNVSSLIAVQPAEIPTFRHAQMVGPRLSLSAWLRPLCPLARHGNQCFWGPWTEGTYIQSSWSRWDIYHNFNQIPSCGRCCLKYPYSIYSRMILCVYLELCMYNLCR